MSAAEKEKYNVYSPGLIACMRDCGFDKVIIPAICIAVCPCNRIKDAPALSELELRVLKAMVKLYIEKKDKTAAQEIYGNVPEQPTTNKGQNTGSTVGS